MKRILIAGGGWAGCAAALSAAKQGAEVILLEKTDLLLGAGNVGGIMRNNGRLTAEEENRDMGAGELFEIADQCAVHRNVDFPGHEHASFYDAALVEPAVRRLLQELGVRIYFCSRAVDVKLEEPFADGRKRIAAVEVIQDGQSRWMEAE
ncbi:MAG: FAD-dependent oxidoreductase, partial [Firmicutes bacterium]|nr:FAD-dependent oxidoreductase [Bacillota bacterium]